MAKRTVTNDKTSISKLPNDKPVVYRIKTKTGNVNYVGVAKRGRVQARLKEHLPGGKDYVPGATLQIEQCGSIVEAKKKESYVIAKALRLKPSQVKSPAKTGKISRTTARSVFHRVTIPVRDTTNNK